MELILSTTQRLQLSQKMLQSTEILQMGSVELTEYLKSLSTENPVVDIEENFESVDKYQQLKQKIENLYQSDYSGNRTYAETNRDDDYKDKWNILDNKGENIQDYLMYQVYFMHLTKRHRKIIEYMINCIDQRGYLGETVEDIASCLKISVDEVEKVLHILQQLEPAGIGARDLKECLRLQMQRNGIADPLLFEIVDEGLELLAKNQLHMMAKKWKVSIEKINELCAIIRNLNPKPGNSFASNEQMKFIYPDVIIVKNNDQFEILLNDSMYPRIHINASYQTIVNNNTSQEANQYISDKIRQAEWVVKCVTLRNQTLRNTVTEIIRIQYDFFMHGPNYLAPMKLLDISEKLEMHESTISRAIKDKYLQCSWGVFPLCHFFNNAIETNTESLVTPCAVKKAIKEIVAAEDRKSPKSDREITEELIEKGFKISRRTVSKYREELLIPKAQGRKVY